MEIYDKIKFLCKQHKITIAELERNLSISNGTIGKWKTAQPRRNNLLAVANFFNVSVDYLLDLTDEQQQKSPTDTKSMSDKDFTKFLNDNGYSVENLIAKLAKLNDKQIKLLIEFVDELVKNKQ